VEWEAAEDERARTAASREAAARGVEKAAERARTRGAPAARSGTPSDRRGAERRVEEAEHEVARLEARVAELTAALADGALYDGQAEGVRRAGELGRELDEVRAALEAALAAWSRAAGGGDEGLGPGA
jgi:ATP-binding cassette subfamily F protein 3